MAVTKTHLVLVAAAALLAAGLYFYPHTPAQPMGKTRIVVGSATLLVDIADTDEERIQGLSGRESLPEGEGLLFLFDTADSWGIWMKDMQFPIDILWADAEGRISTIAADISPATYPEVFLPSAPAQYVLELPAGYAAKAGIAEGDKIVL